MIISFTGTREGMSVEQKEAVNKLLLDFAPAEVHHGDCVGADAEFHLIANHGTGIPKLVIHPPEDTSQRAFCYCHESMEPKEYLARDRDIVEVSNLLIATPKEAEEPKAARAGGTWYTIRYARKTLKKGFIVWPDGSLEEIMPAAEFTLGEE